MDFLGVTLSYVLPYSFYGVLSSARNRLYTGYHKRRFAHFGASVFIWHPHTLIGEQYIRIGDKNIFEPGIQLTARKTGVETPLIEIGNNCLISQHISIVASGHNYDKKSLISKL